MKKIYSPTDNPAFLLIEEGYNPLREREIESLFTVGNGYLGTRSSLEEQGSASNPATLVAGVYGKTGADATEELAVVPDWLLTRIYVEGEELILTRESLIEHRRILDLKRAVLIREWRHRNEKGRITTVKYLRFASLADRHLMVLILVVIPENHRAQIRVETGIKPCQKCSPALAIIESGALEDTGIFVTSRARFSDIVIAEAQVSRFAGASTTPDYRINTEQSFPLEEWLWQADIGQSVTIDKFVSIYTSRDTDRPGPAARKHVKGLADQKLNDILSKHVDAWAHRWRTSSITIQGDPDAQKWINFATYHLIIAANPLDERSSISARALTGTVYKGHIFWDTEMFILPFFIYTHPECARAMLMYRYHTLPAARKKAAEMGYKGALYAWESAMNGDEMTPPVVLAPTGEIIPILSGKLEQHINAAVAYGAWLYWNATQDVDFLIIAGVEMLAETARFWASRVEEGDGAYHIYDVEGPDEYHEGVDDNIYTNMMAAWNLKRAVEAIDYVEEFYPDVWSTLQNNIELATTETERWVEIADNIYKDVIHSGSLIEQFDGYFDLRDIDVADYEPRTAALDVILGREKTAASQVVKQADVVMLLYLMEDGFTEKMLRDNFEYYDRRTAHGSSLCPSIYGLVAVRLGLMETSMRYFRQAGTIDLANNMGNASGGVHAAALGGLWQQVIMGFAGIRVKKDGIYLYPRMPDSWNHLTFSLRWRNQLLHFDVEREKYITVTVEGDREVGAGIYNRPLGLLAPGRIYRAGWDGVTWQGFNEQKA